MVFKKKNALEYEVFCYQERFFFFPENMVLLCNLLKIIFIKKIHGNMIFSANVLEDDLSVITRKDGISFSEINTVILWMENET